MGFDPISASIMGVMGIAQSFMGASQESAQRRQQYEQEKARTIRENQLNARLIAASNKRMLPLVAVS